MPLSNPQLDDELLTDANVPISGVNNSLPPSALDTTSASDAENRLTQRDGLNRPRPGIIRLVSSPTGSWDSIHHLGAGQFFANDGPNWYTYDNRTTHLLSSVAGGPAFASGVQVYSTIFNQTLYFSYPGSGLNKYLPGTGFGTVALPTNGPTCSYPIMAGNRLIYAYQNTLIISDILNPEYFDVVTGSLTIDPIATDQITGISVWQSGGVIAFRNGSTWIINTGPGLDVPSWSLGCVSSTIGTRCHGTVIQTETDVIFLSETGRGVYQVSQAPSSNQQGVWLPTSVDIQAYIDRINWDACDNARATFWNDLYMLSVPLDGAIYNNYCLIYSVSLDKWMGTWCFDIANNDVAVRDFARDRTDPNSTQLLIVTRDGILSKFTYPTDRIYYDQNIDNSQQPIDSSLTTRAFTFGTTNVSQAYTYGQSINQIRPHSARLQFLESLDLVNLSVIINRSAEAFNCDLETVTYLLSLTIPGFPFDLDVEGYRNVIIGLLAVGLCSELQIQLSGTGNWTLYMVKVSAFQSMPLIAT